jgi:hypothetical protein
MGDFYPLSLWKNSILHHYGRVICIDGVTVGPSEADHHKSYTKS